MNNKDKAQAGLEYLMTYGWALILIVSTASILFLIFSPPASQVVFKTDQQNIFVRSSNVTPPQDGTPAKFTVEFQNGTGRPIVIKKITPPSVMAVASPPNCETSCSLSVPSGGTVKVEGEIASDYSGAASLQIDYEIDSYSKTLLIEAKGNLPVAAAAGPLGAPPAVELCEVAGDEDGDGFADCLDTANCPQETFCNASHTNICWHATCIADSCPLNKDCVGDIDFDGTVGQSDLTILQGQFLQSCNASNHFCNGANLNCDAYVDILDFGMLNGNWGACP